MRRFSFIVIVSVLAVGVLFGLSGASYANKVIEGVHVQSLDLGGLPMERAEAGLTEMAAKLAVVPVAVKYEDRSWLLDAGSLGVRLDVGQTLEKALTVGHTGNILQQWRERHWVKNNTMQINPVVVVDSSELEKEILEKAAGIITEPVNAGFKITAGDKVETVPGRMGARVDFTLLEKKLVRAVTARDNGPAEVELPVVTVSPQQNVEDIIAMGINGLIASYSTNFDRSQVGRTYNIKVAAAALDGVLLQPGDEFSFNKVVGPRSSEAGYKNANVIINNELVEGLGGGVCQVSSTLYNAVLLANLKITDRSNHSLPIGYVPIGRDATVVYDAIDFRFVNCQNNYVYIKSNVNESSLDIKVFGDKNKAPKVEVSSWITEEIEPRVVYEKDPHLATGEQVVKQKGSKGFKATTVRIVYRDDEKFTEQLPASNYHAVNRVIAVGTGAVKPSIIIPGDNSPADDERGNPEGTGQNKEDANPADSERDNPEVGQNGEDTNTADEDGIITPITADGIGENLLEPDQMEEEIGREDNVEDNVEDNEDNNDKITEDAELDSNTGDEKQPAQNGASEDGSGSPQPEEGDTEENGL